MAISTAPGSLLPPLRGELECPPDQWQFGLDSREVMLARTSQAVTGDLSGTEARRMVLEKQLAAIRGQLAYTRALLRGDPDWAQGPFRSSTIRDVLKRVILL